jgi:hypothetical protein
MNTGIFSNSSSFETASIIFGGVLLGIAAVVFPGKGAIKFHEIVEKNILEYRKWEPDEIQKIKTWLPAALAGTALLVLGAVYAFFSFPVFVGTAAATYINFFIGGWYVIARESQIEDEKRDASLKKQIDDQRKNEFFKKQKEDNERKEIESNKNKVIDNLKKGIFVEISDIKAVYKNIDKDVKSITCVFRNNDDLSYICKTFPNIEELSLFACGHWTEEGTAHLRSLACLKKLEFKSFQLTDSIFAQLCSLNKLQKLHLPECSKITNEGLAKLANMQNLEELLIINCNKITDDGLRYINYFHGFKELCSLTLSNCENLTTANIAAKLSNHPSLKTVYLSKLDSLTETERVHLNIHNKSIRFFNIDEVLIHIQKRNFAILEGSKRNVA